MAGSKYFNVRARVEGDRLIFEVDLTRSYGRTGKYGDGPNVGIAKTGAWPMAAEDGQPRADGLSYSVAVWRSPTEDESARWNR